MKFVTADTHFGHTNIIRYTGRPFRTAKQMDDTMIKNWNRVVHNNDIVYHLGDFALVPDYRARSIMRSLSGYKILILGNHDRSKQRMLDIGFDEVYDPPIWKEGVLMSHEPIFVTGKQTINVGVDVNNFTPIRFPLRNDIVLCGHIHEKWKVR